MQVTLQHSVQEQEPILLGTKHNSGRNLAHGEHGAVRGSSAGLVKHAASAQRRMRWTQDAAATWEWLQLESDSAILVSHCKVVIRTMTWPPML
jgi:hypothetical protein